MPHSDSSAMFVLLGDIAEIENDFVYWYRCYLSLVSLCVTFVHCAQTAEDIDTISFAYDSPMSLPDRVKIWVTSVNPFLHKFCPKVTHRCWFERRRVRRHSMATNCGRMAIEIAQWSQWRAYRKPSSLFRMTSSLTPYDLQFQNAPARTNYATHAATWRIW